MAREEGTAARLAMRFLSRMFFPTCLRNFPERTLSYSLILKVHKYDQEMPLDFLLTLRLTSTCGGGYSHRNRRGEGQEAPGCIPLCDPAIMGANNVLLTRGLGHLSLILY